MSEEPLFITLEDALEIHLNQIELYGGAHGIRDLGLLESAIAMPQASLGGEFLHAGLYAMGAAYLFHIAKNHPFLDGNKRAAAATALAFLVINGCKLLSREEDLVDLVLQVTMGEAGKPEIELFLRSIAPSLPEHS